MDHLGRGVGRQAQSATPSRTDRAGSSGVVRRLCSRTRPRVVKEDEVGEGAADVDAEAMGGKLEGWRMEAGN